MKRILLASLITALLIDLPSPFIAPSLAAEPSSTTATSSLESKPDDPYFANFQPVKAPAPTGLMLKQGDRLAICGDSITEQKMYSRIMETYLTVCVPELQVTVRQYGWGGETAPGFLARMTNDCLRFHPTIATTCYGMNDHGYRPYEPAIGERYRTASTAIVQSFKRASARVVLGSPGCVGKNPAWSKAPGSSMEALNLNLCQLRNLDIEIAAQEKVGFADVFWPMLQGGRAAQQKSSPEFAIAGKDGVHPDWAGQLVMAYAFLHALGLDGEIGVYTVDLAAEKAQLSSGHELLGFRDGELTIKSQRYPFCASGPEDKDNSIRAGMALVPFNQDLNRLMLVLRNTKAANYRVTWGQESRVYSAEQLGKGINLAQEFAVNPFSEAFAKINGAVAAERPTKPNRSSSSFTAMKAKSIWKRRSR